MTLPHGTKLADLAKVIDFMAKDIFARLPSGCTNCTSGDHLIIREQLEQPSGQRLWRLQAQDTSHPATGLDDLVACGIVVPLA